MKEIIHILIFFLMILHVNSQTYSIKKYVMGSSSATVENADFKVSSTLGQNATGKQENQNNISYSGFWFTSPSETFAIHNIFLALGWNLISSYVQPNNTSIPVVWDEVKDNVVIVKNNAGSSYIPAFDIDDIKNWNISEGYQVYASLADTLVVTGPLVVPENSPISLNAGWNIISYLRKSELDCETAFASITDNGNLIIVKDNFGNTYIPAYDINSIGNLKSGQGYQIYVINPDSLIYPVN